MVCSYSANGDVAVLEIMNPSNAFGRTITGFTLGKLCEHDKDFFVCLAHINVSKQQDN